VLSNEASVACDDKNGVFLIAITKAGKAKNLTSSAFINKYRLSSSSSVQSAIVALALFFGDFFGGSAFFYYICTLNFYI
jgi:hypothetical protein